jgi:hypothetical protein
MFLAELTAVAAFVAAGVVAWRLGGGAWVFEFWYGARDFSWLALPSIEVNAGVFGAASTWRWIALALLAWTALIPAAFSLARFADRGGEPQANRQNGN